MASSLDLDQQLCFPLYAAVNLTTRLYRPRLQALGLTYPQYLVMLVLWQESPLKVCGIGQRLMLDSGTLTPLLKRLQQAGLVNRSRSPLDERQVLVSLTEAGLALRARAESIPESLLACIPMEAERLAHLRDELKSLICAVNTALDHSCPASTDEPPTP